MRYGKNNSDDMKNKMDENKVEIKNPWRNCKIPCLPLSHRLYMRDPLKEISKLKELMKKRVVLG
jgi:hypothetical protein